ncbi:MAG: hypothetical protein Q9163_003123 [Psora crenata]
MSYGGITYFQLKTHKYGIGRFIALLIDLLETYKSAPEGFNIVFLFLNVGNNDKSARIYSAQKPPQGHAVSEPGGVAPPVTNTHFSNAVNVQSQAAIQDFEQRVLRITTKNSELSGLTGATLSSSVGLQGLGVGGNFEYGRSTQAYDLPPIHEHAQRLISSSKDLVAQYQFIKEQIILAGGLATSKANWQGDAEKLAGILESQARKMKREITVLLHGQASVTEEQSTAETALKEDEIWDEFVGAMSEAGRADMSERGSWAVIAKSTEGVVHNLAKCLFNEDTF